MSVLGIFLDTETNGLNPFKHRAIDIAFILVELRTGRLIGSFQAPIALTAEDWKLSDPTSLKINGFSWDEVSKGDPPEAVAEAIRTFFFNHGIQRGKAVFVCQNPSFDRAFFSQLVPPETQEALLWPYHWLDLASMYWTQAIKGATPSPHRFPWDTGCSKDKIASVYQIPPEESPHRALNGVKHLLLCYQAVIGFPEKDQ